MKQTQTKTTEMNKIYPAEALGADLKLGGGGGGAEVNMQVCLKSEISETQFAEI